MPTQSNTCYWPTVGHHIPINDVERQAAETIAFYHGSVGLLVGRCSAEIQAIVYAGIFAATGGCNSARCAMAVESLAEPFAVVVLCPGWSPRVYNPPTKPPLLSSLSVAHNALRRFALPLR